MLPKLRVSNNRLKVMRVGVARRRKYTITQTRVRLWTVNEYNRMFETGIITEVERVELIDGRVIPMSAKNPVHAATTPCAPDYLKRLLVEIALLRVQNPIYLSQYSEPEPDIAGVRIDSRKYIHLHPAPNKIFLLTVLAYLSRF
ncbi:Uma2 family endonuclease [Nostoc sp. CALU 546]|uniref:Uma2 family endonuclease n=1 Tax=Nostoc sp. CALU 546 TaxID=1867241 RepID=UPI003B675AA0